VSTQPLKKRENRIPGRKDPVIEEVSGQDDISIEAPLVSTDLGEELSIRDEDIFWSSPLTPEEIVADLYSRR
jgi:hypothetical protein